MEVDMEEYFMGAGNLYAGRRPLQTKAVVTWRLLIYTQRVRMHRDIAVRRSP